MSDFLAGVKRVAAKEPPGALLSVYDVRHELGWPKLKFDATALKEYRAGNIVLHHHDHPGGLSPSEVNNLIYDGRGTYYVGIALPRSRASRVEYAHKDKLSCGGSCMAAKKKARKAPKRKAKKARRKAKKASVGFTSLKQVENALVLKKVRSLSALRKKVCR